MRTMTMCSLCDRMIRTMIWTLVLVLASHVTHVRGQNELDPAGQGVCTKMITRMDSTVTSALQSKIVPMQGACQWLHQITGCKIYKVTFQPVYKRTTKLNYIVQYMCCNGWKRNGQDCEQLPTQKPHPRGPQGPGRNDPLLPNAPGYPVKPGLGGRGQRQNIPGMGGFGPGGFVPRPGFGPGSGTPSERTDYNPSYGPGPGWRPGGGPNNPQPPKSPPSTRSPMTRPQFRPTGRGTNGNRGWGPTRGYGPNSQRPQYPQQPQGPSTRRPAFNPQVPGAGGSGSRTGVRPNQPDAPGQNGGTGTDPDQPAKKESGSGSIVSIMGALLGVLIVFGIGGVLMMYLSKRKDLFGFGRRSVRLRRNSLRIRIDDVEKGGASDTKVTNHVPPIRTRPGVRKPINRGSFPSTNSVYSEDGDSGIVKGSLSEQYVDEATSMTSSMFETNSSIENTSIHSGLRSNGGGVHLQPRKPGLYSYAYVHNQDMAPRGFQDGGVFPPSHPMMKFVKKQGGNRWDKNVPFVHPSPPKETAPPVAHIVGKSNLLLRELDMPKFETGKVILVPKNPDVCPIIIEHNVEIEPELELRREPVYETLDSDTESEPSVIDGSLDSKYDHLDHGQLWPTQLGQNLRVDAGSQTQINHVNTIKRLETRNKPLYQVLEPSSGDDDDDDDEDSFDVICVEEASDATNLLSPVNGTVRYLSASCLPDANGQLPVSVDTRFIQPSRKTSSLPPSSRFTTFFL